jgi:hypothetical protein
MFHFTQISHRNVQQKIKRKEKEKKNIRNFFDESNNCAFICGTSELISKKNFFSCADVVHSKTVATDL